MLNEYFKTNQALWDQKTPVHLKSEMYDLENFKKGETSLNSIELGGLGDVKGKSVLHLQCHFGQDSLSLARMGAKVTGMDLSPEAIKTARELNEELGLDATFVESNIYDLPDNLTGQFDIVFTSYGVLTWLPDLKKWASIINHFLKPGGTFLIAEFHPTWYLFDFDTKQIGYNYFSSPEPYMEVTDGTYADRESGLKHKEYFWCHSLQETIQPLLQEGLTLLDFQEFDYSPYNCFPNLRKRAHKEFIFEINGAQLPHVFMLKMQK